MWARAQLRLTGKSLTLSGFIMVLMVPILFRAQHIQTDSVGAQIFQEQCSGCHTIGGGDLVGPDLARVTQRRDQQWLVNFISNPRKMISAGDPIATALYQKYGNQTMPKLGLTQVQVMSVIAYLASPNPGSGNSTNPVNLSSGDVTKGKALFMGNTHFQNDGPPCMGCHNLGSNGLLGGGTLGPDLTKVASTYTDVSLAATLANIPWPVMKPIYTKHPLTDEEQADLRAFLLSAPGQKPTNKEVWVIGISLAGLAGVVSIIGILSRQRLRPVRRSLVNRARSGKGLTQIGHPERNIFSRWSDRMNGRSKP